MADTVQYLLESSVPELDDLHSRGLFSKVPPPAAAETLHPLPFLPGRLPPAHVHRDSPYPHVVCVVSRVSQGTDGWSMGLMAGGAAPDRQEALALRVPAEAPHRAVA